MKSNRNSELASLARALHDLFCALPAIRQHRGANAVHRQIELIAYYRRKYDLLAATPN